MSYLRSLTAADGHIRYSRGADQTPVWVTAEALMALAGRPLPIAPVAIAASTNAKPRVGVRATVHRPKRVTRGRRATRRTGTPVSAIANRLIRDVGLLDALALAPVR
jgi:hypothetical protein